MKRLCVEPFFTLCTLFLVFNSLIPLIYLIYPPIHPPPSLLLPFYTFISFPSVSLPPSFRLSRPFSPLSLSCSPAVSSLLPSTLVLFIICHSSSPLSYHSPLFHPALAQFSPSRQTPYPLSPHMLKAWPWDLCTEGPCMVMGKALKTGASQAER